MNLREALDRAASLGADVVEVRNSGETRVSHPSMPRHVTVNRRRKDAHGALRSWVRQLETRVTMGTEEGGRA